MQAFRSSTKSSAYPRFFPLIGDSRLPPALIAMTCEGQMRSHCRHPMQASSPSSSWRSAKLDR